MVAVEKFTVLEIPDTPQPLEMPDLPMLHTDKLFQLLPTIVTPFAAALFGGVMGHVWGWDKAGLLAGFVAGSLVCLWDSRGR
jgi:hypothetical protein